MGQRNIIHNHCSVILVQITKKNPKNKNIFQLKLSFFLKKLFCAKCEKKKILLFRHICSGQSVVFRSVSSRKGLKGLHALSNISRKKKKKNSLTDSHLMDTSRCCHRTWFSSRWTKMTQLGALKCWVQPAHSIAHPARTQCMEIKVAKGKNHASSHHLWTAVKWYALTLTMLKPFSFDLVSSFTTRGEALMFADNQIQRHMVQLSKYRTLELPACPPSPAPPTASHWQGHYLCHCPSY